MAEYLRNTEKSVLSNDWSGLFDTWNVYISLHGEYSNIETLLTTGNLQILFLFSPSFHLSSVTNSRVWDVNTGEMLNTLIHHCEAVLHLRFNNGMMVTCSKDRSIAVWDMASPTDITLRRVLVGHRAAVNVVDFDDKYIVSASGDRTIKVQTLKSS